MTYPKPGGGAIIKSIPLVTLRFDGLTVSLPASDPIQYYETFVLDVYGQLRIRPGDFVVDIGANVGDFTVYSSKRVGPSGRILAVEPNPAWKSVIQTNLRLNEIKNVRVVESAISDTAGVVEIEGCPKSIVGNGNLDPARIAVHSDTLDNVVFECLGRPPDVIKVDIEGHEVSALEHQNCLEGVREIIVETHGPRREAEVFTILQERGFHVTRFSLTHALANIRKSLVNNWFSIAEAELRTSFYGLRRAIGSVSSGRFIATANRHNQSIKILHGVRQSEGSTRNLRSTYKIPGA